MYSNRWALGLCCSPTLPGLFWYVTDAEALRPAFKCIHISSGRNAYDLHWIVLVCTAAEDLC